MKKIDLDFLNTIFSRGTTNDELIGSYLVKEDDLVELKGTSENGHFCGDTVDPNACATHTIQAIKSSISPIEVDSFEKLVSDIEKEFVPDWFSNNPTALKLYNRAKRLLEEKRVSRG